jgi:uncharacterized SAM-binding protein YcdF (DUF218 family)
MVAAAAIYLLLPVALNGAARRLVREDPLAKADVIIALGGDARCLRERGAVELYRRGYASKIVVSGIPYAWGIHSGEAARRYVLSLGVRDEDVAVLKRSWNTRNEAAEMAELMRRNNWRAAIIVTSPFHSRRAAYTFEHWAPDLKFISAPIPAEAPEWQPERWWSRRGDLGVTIREFLSWLNTLFVRLQ